MQLTAQLTTTNNHATTFYGPRRLTTHIHVHVHYWHDVHRWAPSPAPMNKYHVQINKFRHKQRDAHFRFSVQQQCSIFFHFFLLFMCQCVCPPSVHFCGGVCVCVTPKFPLCVHFHFTFCLPKNGGGGAIFLPNLINVLSIWVCLCGTCLILLLRTKKTCLFENYWQSSIAFYFLHSFSSLFGSFFL